MADAQADPAYQTLLSSLGAERLDLSPAQTTAFVQADKVAMAQLLGKLNLLDKSRRPGGLEVRAQREQLGTRARNVLRPRPAT